MKPLSNTLASPLRSMVKECWQPGHCFWLLGSSPLTGVLHQSSKGNLPLHLPHVMVNSGSLGGVAVDMVC